MAVNDFILIIGTLFSLIAMIYFTVTFNFMYINAKVEKWLIVNGEILKSTLETEEDSFIYDEDEFNKSSTIKYKVIITYSYEVGGTRFKSKNLFASKINNLFLSSQEHKNLQKKYTTGDSIKVYVDPNDSYRSSLINKIPVSFKLISATLFLTIGLIFILMKDFIASFV